MAGAAIGVATAACEGGCLETEGEAELLVGHMWANAFYDQNRCFSPDVTHEFNSSTNRTKLAGRGGGILNKGPADGAGPERLWRWSV
jgi:hypothetical protein